MRMRHLSYIGMALGEYKQVCGEYHEQLQAGKDAAPELRLEMPLDER